ncbi:MAG TPA: DUF2721 domain-containing protein [Candidatus Angelobacter sp.]|nr:DUF2721 domain-containing protein [Candidatus Angelobacter sp.]
MHTVSSMAVPVVENPFAVLTLIAAPAVFTNASSVLALGTGNRLARVVDRTRVLSQTLHSNPPEPAEGAMWGRHIERLEKRAELLVRAMSFFYTAVGAFAAASLVSLLGASLAGSRYNLPFTVIAGISFIVGIIGFLGLSLGCTLLVRETRLALLNHHEEARLAKSWLK